HGGLRLADARVPGEDRQLSERETMLPEVLAAAALDLGEWLGADAPCAGRVLPVRVGEVALVEGNEVVQAVPGGEVVGRVGLLPVDGGSDDAHGRRMAVEVPPDP